MVIPYGARNDRIPKTGTRSKMSKRVYGISQYTGAKVANHDVRKKVQPWQKVQRERGLSGSGLTAFGKPGSPLDVYGHVTGDMRKSSADKMQNYISALQA